MKYYKVKLKDGTEYVTQTETPEQVYSCYAYGYKPKEEHTPYTPPSNPIVRFTEMTAEEIAEYEAEIEKRLQEAMKFNMEKQGNTSGSAT